jgi:hypothetical protein
MNLTQKARFCAERREIHAILRQQFPVRSSFNYVAFYDAKLADVELEAYASDFPPLVSEPYHSDYAFHLDGLSIPRLGAHYYCFMGTSPAFIAEAATWSDADRDACLQEFDDVLQRLRTRNT